MKKVLWWGLLGFLGLVVLMQFIPLAGARTNPPVRAEPSWDSPQTRELVRRACYDCHSNETVWPWYSRVAPISWLVISDVNRGREELNFSEWFGGEEGAEDSVETILDGSMPPRSYLLTHPEARLGREAQQTLIDGLWRSLGRGVARDD